MMANRMSAFNGTVVGDRQQTDATRRGFKRIKAAAQSWDGSLISELWYEKGKLMLRLSYCLTSGTCGDTLYSGAFSDFVKMHGGFYESD